MYKQYYILRCLVFFTLIPAISACTRAERAIKMKGSDTEVNLAVNLAEEFSKSNQHFSIAISGGGSGLGIAALLNGQADIANSSRPLTEEEVAMFKKKNIELKTIVFAEDATAFVVHQDNPIDEIDLKNLADVLNGTITNWESVSGRSMPINIYGRQSSSGTYSFIRNKLGINFSPAAKEMTGNAQILEGVKIDRSGIGYVGAGYIAQGDGNNQGVKVLKIKDDINPDAISPLDAEAIKNSLYFFQRPLYQFVPAESWEKVAPFIHFETTGEGRALIQRSGYFVLN